MEGSNYTKLYRLTQYLMRHPRMIPRYCRERLWNRPPIEMALPWISYAAIERLETFLNPSHDVVEFGGGGSTLFFASRVASVLCIESNREWAERIRDALTIAGIENVSIEVHSYAPLDIRSYETSENLARIRGQLFDVILVDGYEEDVPLRPTCFWHAERSIRDGGIIIVDDSWRYPILREINRAKRWEEHRSIGPGRWGVTSTDIFYY